MPPARRGSLAPPAPEILADRLASLPALASLSRRCVEALSRAGLARAFERGEEILVQGGRTESFYVLLAGRVKLCRTLANGRSVTLALLGPGELFGAPAALGAQFCDAAAVAQEAGTCLEVSREALFGLFARQPALVAELLPLLTRQLAECRNCIVELSCYRVETRFAQFFLKLAERLGDRRPEGLFIPIRLSRLDLAEMVGTTIETAIRVMSRWRSDGVLETRRGGFLVRDREALEALALA
jgi:CRP/FNR family transcriptional regulator